MNILQPHFERHEYDINIVDCYNAFSRILDNEELTGMKISVEEYKHRLKTSVKVFASGKGIKSNWSRVAKQHAFIVDQEHPSFDSWLAYNLSTVESYKIPLILDHFYENTAGTKEHFVNFIDLSNPKYPLFDFHFNSIKPYKYKQENLFDSIGELMLSEDNEVNFEHLKDMQGFKYWGIED